MTDQQRDQYEERAAILEFDAGFTRAEAERKAREMVCGPVREVKRDLFGREISG